MIWFIELCNGFLKVLNDLFYFMVNPLNITLSHFDIDLDIPYIGDMSPIMLITGSLILFIIISFILRLVHG